jgi:hypothetical protein
MANVALALMIDKGGARGLADAGRACRRQLAAAQTDHGVPRSHEGTAAGPRRPVIYLDTPVALAHLLTEDRSLPESIWRETLVSSRLLCLSLRGGSDLLFEARQKIADFAGGSGLAVEVPLDLRAAFRPHLVKLFSGFDAFDRRCHA